MKKVAMLLAVVAVMALSVAPAMATGFIEGYGGTATLTELSAGAVSNSCGSACDWGFNSFMSSAQAGELSLGLKGCANCGTGVAGEVNVGYNTGYAQDRDIPGGYQKSWGEQWGSGTVKMFPAYHR